ncbi:hypothetical protein OG896_34940 [Streptomyces sp. NBC_00669]|uniref:hypothetical protein n=1 Tax=Streptomyces sp. NBC_00669 TaxID=2976011 RepID=UPI002E2F5406|nr:hypothetical protein [Streptomyces sp. NBC_00669]
MARRSAAGAICLAAVVAAATACGSGGDSPGGGRGASGTTPRPSGTAAASGTADPAGSRSADRMLGQRQLEQAAVGPADLPGSGWSTDTVSGRGPDGVEIKHTIPDVTRLPRVSPAACAPLGGIAMGPVSTTRQHHAVLIQDVLRTGKGHDSVEDALLAYRPADARGVMTDLRASLKACDSFPERDGDRFADPKPRATPSVGDDAVEYDLTRIVASVDDSGDLDGGKPAKAPFRFLVVRSGATIAVFSNQGFPGDHPVIPAEVVSAQIAKLAKAG